MGLSCAESCASDSQSRLNEDVFQLGNICTQLLASDNDMASVAISWQIQFNDIQSLNAKLLQISDIFAHLRQVRAQSYRPPWFDRNCYHSKNLVINCGVCPERELFKKEIASSVLEYPKRLWSYVKRGRASHLQINTLQTVSGVLHGENIIDCLIALSI
ncbi:hypothetical protein GJ496_005510 [Pomphorhynchus laevis]|nr:hypothetical protein GJ496_005510 [Pomphorhynchus laevis]